MVGEIFQEIMSSLSLVAILVCLVIIIFVLVPCSDEVFQKGRSNTVADSADKEKLYERNHRNFQVSRDLREGRVIGLSGLLSKGDDDNEEDLKSANEAGNDKELFSGVPEESKVEETMPVGEVVDELSERPTLSSQIKEEEQEGLVDETPLSYNSGDEDGVSEAKRQEISEVLETDKPNTERAGYHEGEEVFLFDDWEGIERTELEKLFGKAVAFVSSKSNADLLDRNLKLQLYGLHKVATEGPCHESRPIPLKLSARAKWYQPYSLDLHSPICIFGFMIKI